MFWFILVCDIFIPFIMVFAGYIMWKHPPKEINSIIGYRTTRSMKNVDTWKFAHEHCGKLWFYAGLIMLVPSIVAHIPFYGDAKDALDLVCLIVIGIQLLVLVGSIFPTERALKKNFDDDGMKK